MAVRLTTAAIAIVLCSAGGSACAMTGAGSDRIDCTVLDAGKLTSVAGGADAVCEAIRQRATAEGMVASFRVEVRVLSRSLVSATVTTPDGRRLPELRLASADRPIDESSLNGLARSIIAQLRANVG